MKGLSQRLNVTYLAVLWADFTVFTLCLASILSIFALRVRLSFANSAFTEHSLAPFILVNDATLGKVRIAIAVNLVGTKMLFFLLLGIQINL
jgi:hypothetical protein